MRVGRSTRLAARPPGRTDPQPHRLLHRPRQRAVPPTFQRREISRAARGGVVPRSTASTARTRVSFMPAIQPGKWFEKVRCLRPNAAMMTSSLCTPGNSKQATRRCSMSTWVGWHGSTRTSTCRAAAVSRGRDLAATRSDVTCTRRGTSGPHTNVLEQTTQARGRKQPIDRLSLRRFGHLARRSRRPRNSRFGLVYSSPMTGNRPEITGSHRGFEIANAIGAQRKPQQPVLSRPKGGGNPLESLGVLPGM
jgi:hypothetical protein